MLRYITVFILFIVFGFSLFSQGNPSQIPFPGEPCASSYLEDELLRTDPAYLQMRNLMEQQVQSFIAQQSSSRAAGVIYTIPVVFHIMHEGEAIGDSTNIPYAQALSCIAALNRDFRRTNADGGIAQSGPLGVDAEIEFCMAQRDPNGNFTNGVTRHDMSGDQGYLDSGVYHNAGLWRHDASMKAMVQWNPTEYLNIWVVNKIRSVTNIYAGGGGGIIGYATFPGGTASRDGVVIRFSATGNDPTGALGYNLWFATDDGRVLTHELGHYLNLFHTFSGGLSCGTSVTPGCLTTGDRCCDTPPTVVGAGNNCTTPVCPLENKENYMQYQNGACASDFTPDQVARMRAVLASSAWWGRNDLVTNNNCIAPPAIDLEMDTIFVPVDNICSNNFTPQIVICNISSSESITSFDIKYKVDGSPESTFSWSGIFPAGDCDTFLLPSVTTTNGSHTFTARIDSLNLNGTENDVDASNNIKISNFSVSSNTNGPIQTISICDSFSSPSGKIWKTNGTYYDTITNASGCDSLMTFNITISGTSIVTTFNVTECDSLISPSGKIWKVGGVHYDTLVGANGCDSLLKYFLTINYSSVDQIVKLVSSDRSQYDWFSRSVSINGNYAVIGAVFEDHNVAGNAVESDAGSAYIFEKDSSGQWSQIQKIVASDRDRDDYFGHTVSIHGNYLIVGATEEDHDATGSNLLNESGSAYLFERQPSGVWLETQKLVASDREANDHFGWSVSLYGNTAIISAYEEDEDVSGSNSKSNAGSVYVFERNGSGVWLEKQKLVASDRGVGDEFGQSVSISGNTLLIGTHLEDQDLSGGNTLGDGGSAYFFEKNQSGIWLEKQKIVASDRGAFDYFGFTVSVDKSYAVIGAYQEDHDETGGNMMGSAGSAYIYERGNNGVWSEKQKIVAPDRTGFDFFGNAVSVSGNYILVGASFEAHDVSGANFVFNSGSAYVFKRESTGVWNHKQKITANVREPNDQFGYSLALDGNTALIGSTYEDHDNNELNPVTDVGSAYIFQLSSYSSTADTTLTVCNTHTTPSGKILDSTGTYYDTIANSVGCDSVITFYLTVNSTRFDTTLTVCDSVISPNGKIWKTTGIYYDTLTNSISCDSILRYNLSVSPSFVSVTLSMCDSMVSPTGKVWKTSGTYLDTIVNPSGCDSVTSFNLSITGTSAITIFNVTECDSMVSPTGKIWKVGGIHYDTLSTSTGCDSLLKFYLTINYSSINQLVKLVSSDRDQDDSFGSSVSINGNYAIVGAFQEDHNVGGIGLLNNAGSAYIFQKNNNGQWSQIQKIVASDRDANDNFGSSVSIHGDYAVVGAYQEDNDVAGGNILGSAGSAYIFERQTSGIWQEVQKIVASDRGAGDNFGWSVSINNNKAVISAYLEDEDAIGGNTLSNSGSAYVFERNGSGIWLEQQKLVASDRASTDEFGRSVSISDNTILISATNEDQDETGGNPLINSGSAYFFSKNQSGVWIETQKVVSSDRAALDLFGNSVSVDKSFAVIGAAQEDHDEAGANLLSSAGSSYIFERNSNGVWEEKQKLVAPDREASDYFGNAVSVSGNFVLIGAQFESHDTAGLNPIGFAGSAYVFKRESSGVWSHLQKIVAQDRGGSFDLFGNVLGLDGNSVIIGALYEDEDTMGTNTLTDAGSAYIFELKPYFATSDTIVVACYNYTSPSGKLINTAGLFLDTILTATGGCDSIISIDLILNVYRDTLVEISCDTLLWRGVSYFADTLISDTITTGVCDSIFNLDFTKNPTYSSTFTYPSVCDSITLFTGLFVDSSGIYVDKFYSINGCDSNFIFNVTVNQTSRDTLNIITCDSLISPTGKIWKANGTYYDTINNAAGCDSLMTFNLTIYTAYRDTLVQVHCDSPTVWRGNIYSSDTLLSDTVSTGICDSIFTLDFTNNPSYNFNVSIITCDSITLPTGLFVDTSGTYIDSSFTVNFCDSIYVYNVQISYTTRDTQTINVCDSLISPSGKIWKTSGIFTDTTNTLTHPCDSIVTFNLTISTVFRDTLVEIKCDSSISWRGSIYTSTGIVNDTVTTGVCDSIFTLDFTRNPTYLIPITQTVCDSITVLTGRFIDSSGIYRDTFNTINGCDSIYVYNITVNYKDTANINMTVCDSLISPSGKTWKTNGTYFDTINTVNGCDSLMTFNLIINTLYRDTLVEIKCDSSFTWRGTTYNSTIIVNDTVTTGVCDSIYTLDFTRNSTYLTSISHVVCDSITVLTGRFIDSTGIYIDTFNTVNGCDSIFIYNVVVNYKDTATINVTTCDSLVSPSGKSWKTSGIYYDTINTVNGCDSLMTFNLTITTASVITNPAIRSCYSVTFNGVVYTSSQNVYDTLFLPGCDTIKITPIIVDTNTFSISTFAFCDSLVAASGKVYKNSGFYRDTMPNAAGCDSLVEYYLTVYKSTVSNTLITACGSYTSPFGNTYTTSGNYADTLTTTTGCDSIINTLLIIDTVTLATIDSTICFGDSIILSNGTVAKTSGVYYDTVFGSIPSSLLYSEDFQSTPYSFTLNTNDTNAITPGTADNAWIINSSYAGGSVFGSPIVNTPNQDASITGNINSTYLHIHNRRSATLSFPSITNSNYIDGNIVLLGGQNGLNFSKMTNDISTAGKSQVSFDMYYLCRGSFGRLYYSLNSGTTWTRVGGNLNNGGTSWSQISLVNPVFANQPTIRFAVGFNNTDGLGVSPGFAVDQIAINGIGASSSNCDSITTINLTVSPLIDTNLYDTICRGQSITLPGGTLATITGVYRDTLVANTGCDSIVFTNLLVHDTTQSSFNLRQCDTIISPSGKIWTTTGSYIDSIPNSVGCDSVMYINIIIDTLPITLIDTTLCFNDSLQLMNGIVAKTNGTYYDTLPTIRCDSLVIYNIIILPLNDTIVFDSICTYETHTLPSGTIVNTTGVYRDTLTSSINCDSIIITNLFVGDTSSSFQVIATCDSLISPSGKIWRTTGMYLDTIANTAGCDSLMTFNVTISFTTFINSSDTACDSLVWRSLTRSTSGLHYDTITTGVCDTIYVLDLLINNSYNNTVPFVSCDSFTLPGGTTIYTSGFYTDTLMTITGCDSIISSIVTINTANSSTITLTSCDSFISPSGKTFILSGVYLDTILNVGGCDSVITINLTILNTPTTTVLANGCDTFSLPGGTIATTTGIYRDTISGGNGCDSIVITNLILGNSSNVTQTLSLCAGETVTVGSSVYGATGMYSDTFATVLGCDSIINTNLTINPLTPGAITYTTNMCQDAAAVSFIGAPAGGKWFGPGIDSTTGLFDPAIAGVGIHIISYKGPGLCGITDSTTVEVYSVPTINYNLTDDECDVGQGEIDVTIIGGTPRILYTWSTGETTEDLIGLREGSYTLNVIDANGCRARETISIINVSTPDCDYNIFVPNVFSPDGNGENDVLRVEGNGVETVEITIFNRWGNLIFKSTSQDVGWDGSFKGQPVNQGAFVYFVKGTFVDGKSFEDKGTVTVIRR